MACDAVPHCGRKQANRPSLLCRCRRTPRIGGVNCRRGLCNCSSWSGTDHGASDRSVPRRSGAIHRQQGTGQLCKDDPRGIFQWEATAVGWPDQTRQSVAAISLERSSDPCGTPGSAVETVYRRKLIQKGLGKARAAVARKLGIRMWIMLRDRIEYNEFCLNQRPLSSAFLHQALLP